jgi:hypothetical protein
MLTRRRTLVLMFVLAALAVVLLWPRNREPVATSAPPSATPSSPQRTVAAAAVPAPAEDQMPPVTPSRVRKQLEDYKKGAVYPPWSYPLTPDMKFLLEWNKAATNDTLFGDTTDEGIYFRFDADRSAVMPGDTYTAWLEVWKVDADKNRVLLPVVIDSAVIQKTEGPDQSDAVQVSFSDDGHHRYSTQLVPSQERALANASTARIVVYANAAGQRRQLIRDFSYSSKRVLTVLGVSDAMRDGSLVVTLQVQAYEDGVYTFFADLAAADGETPIATTERSIPLKAGRGTADLVFFGKVIRDQGISGPYVVRDLHGLRRGGLGETGIVWDEPRRFTTKPYKAWDFSGAEWDSEEKREKIKRFESVLSAMEGKH